MKKKTVVVTGDITVDWNIARIRHTEQIVNTWNADDRTQAICTPGGTALLSELIEMVAKDLKQSKQADVSVGRVKIEGSVSPTDARFHHSYAMWAPFKSGESGAKKNKLVWRVEEFLGLHPSQNIEHYSKELTKINNDYRVPDVVVLDDAALGFRDSAGCWPQSLSSKKSKTWIILKMARPIAQGKLWETLITNYADRLVVILPVNDLRQSQIM